MMRERWTLVGHRMPTLAGTEEVARIAALARAGGRLGIDTEFMSEGRYRALLCLVQVVADDRTRRTGIRIALFDTLEPLDAAPLAEVLADPAIEIVLHAARQDVALLRRVVEHRGDERLRHAGRGRASPGQGAQTGYGNLLGGVLRLHVAKTASYTRWTLLVTAGDKYADDARDATGCSLLS